ncbi:Putative negative regulator of RcsB-dependent stress response [Rubritalea squalenifaciens DSM 18772]|uniref:Putative negative regulator of RcsB-dependent stress response n=1 Tax=Rubritalea squalenifaciens DSM 18772 TaxID=1123071 RepID=A0A1M6DKY0_9BACT|nr:hypothetical protein [Rubritalea squalenifaciens]SHI73974.1 Putative negative regulator of RcsB-dependent stress response [Rubritalea squalenifaciens DSM 18772]
MDRINDMTDGLLKRVAGSVLACVCLAGPLQAQQFDEGMTRAVEALDDSNWNVAIERLQEIGKSQPEQTVYQKGAISYHHGYALMKRGLQSVESGRVKEGEQDLQAAYAMLDACARLKGEGEDLNVYRKRALLYQGAISQALEKYDEALAFYDRFLLERDQLRDTYERGVMLVNLAICYSLKAEPDLEQASGAFQDAVTNRERWKVDDVQLVRSLGSTMEAYLEKGKEKEYVALVEACRESLTDVARSGESVRRQVLRVAIRAAEMEAYDASNMVLSCLPYQMAPWNKGANDLNLLGEEGVKGGDAEVLTRALELAAYNAEKLGKVDEAVSLCHEMLKGLEPSPELDRCVLQLVRLAHLEKKDEEVVKLADAYLARIQEEEIARELRAYLADSLLQLGSYDQVQELYRGQGHLVADEAFLLIRAAYLGAKYAQVLELMEQYQADISDKLRREEVSYYKLASLVRMQLWPEAEEFLAEHYQDRGAADSEFYRLAHLEKAQVEFARLDLDAAQESLASLLDDPDKTLAATALNLLGNIQQSLRERKEARESYEKALKLGQELGEDELIQESLFYLVALLGQEQVNGAKNKNLKEALPYFDAFMEKYADSEYAAQVLVAGMAAMREADRSGEYLTLFHKVISQMSARDRTPGLELAMDTYLWLLQEEGKTFSEVYQELSRWHPPVRLSAVYRDAFARAYDGFENKAEGKKDASRALLNDARRRILMKDLIADYPPEALAPYIMLNVASYLVEETDTPERALLYYEEVIKRGTIREHIEAQLGMAKLLNKRDEDGDKERAELLLLDVIARSAGDEMGDEALLVLVESYAARGRWPEVTQWAKRYLEQKGHDAKRAKVSYMLAKSYDERGMFEDAIVSYGQIYASYLNSLEISAPAVERLARITWERNKPGNSPADADRQIAYQLAHRYLGLTKEVYEDQEDLLSEGAKKSWKAIEALVDQWEKSGEIKTVEQLLEDRRKGKKSF